MTSKPAETETAASKDATATGGNRATGTNGSNANSSKYATIREGSTVMQYPADQESAVFYNPVQVKNRDLSILMITLAAEQRAVRLALQDHKEQLKAQRQNDNSNSNSKKAKRTQQDGGEQTTTPPKTMKQQLEDYREQLPPASHLLANQDVQRHGMCILDALAASGLRSLRYWQEIPGVKHVTINDLDLAAVERAHDNVSANQLDSALLLDWTTSETSFPFPINQRRGISIQQGNAKQVMYNSQPLLTPLLERAKLSTDNPSSDSTKTRSNHPPLPPIPPPLYAPWDVIDLDPYGSAAPFLDAAVQAVENGGLLCITCTDMAALGGAHPETCAGRYLGSIPLRGASYLQEMALRILLYSVAATAARYGRTVEPLLSVGLDFYVRVFVRIHDNKAGVNELSLQTGHVYQSTQCPSFITVPMGRMGGKKGNVYQAGRLDPQVLQQVETGPPSSDTKKQTEEEGKATDKANNDKDNDDPEIEPFQPLFRMGGPIWLGPLHDAEIIEEALKKLKALKASPASDDDAKSPLSGLSTVDRLLGLFSNCQDELLDAPLFYKMPDMASTLRMSAPPLQSVRNALVNAGYRVSGYHKDPQAVKTDAPSYFMWDILRAWAAQNPSQGPKKDSERAKKKKKKGNCEMTLDRCDVASHILSQPASCKVDFSKPPTEKRPTTSLTLGVARFPLNPQAYWGPKKAATGKRKAPP